MSEGLYGKYTPIKVSGSSEPMKPADRIEELEAENKRLREYYEAREAVSRTGLFFATHNMLRRENEARAALEEKNDA